MPDTSFRHRSWAHRFEQMGDEAESIFEEVWPHGYERWGLNRPRLKVSMLPEMVRYAPDYLTTAAFVEVQGFGADQTCKIKLEKADALGAWDRTHPVRLFLWDKTNREWAIFEWARIVDLIRHGAALESFPEGKRYWAIHKVALDGEWTPHPAPARGSA